MATDPVGGDKHLEQQRINGTHGADPLSREHLKDRAGTPAQDEDHAGGDPNDRADEAARKTPR